MTGRSSDGCTFDSVYVSCDKSYVRGCLYKRIKSSDMARRWTMITQQCCVMSQCIVSPLVEDHHVYYCSTVQYICTLLTTKINKKWIYVGALNPKRPGWKSLLLCWDWLLVLRNTGRHSGCNEQLVAMWIKILHAHTHTGVDVDENELLYYCSILWVIWRGQIDELSGDHNLLAPVDQLAMRLKGIVARGSGGSGIIPYLDIAWTERIVWHKTIRTVSTRTRLAQLAVGCRCVVSQRLSPLRLLRYSVCWQYGGVQIQIVDSPRSSDNRCCAVGVMDCWSCIY